MMFLFFYLIKLFFLFLSFLFIVWDFIVIFKSWIAISFIFNLLLHVFNPKYYFFLQSSSFDADLVYHFTSILWSPHFFLYWDEVPLHVAQNGLKNLEIHTIILTQFPTLFFLTLEIFSHFPSILPSHHFRSLSSVSSEVRAGESLPSTAP